ncbi:AlbA family DNA-binding domain-containing protein [Streptomyces chartreusis]|uniref:AlbA family DNA-binding domain-containing protein n=1 Tax=Streptomyces chartreusis TaxID=1969 RepID=UPI0036AA435E
MTSSLFAASAADLTIEHIRAVAARPENVESLTLEFKREYSTSLLKTIAAMANTYGGLIMVGIVDQAEADKKGCERVVGVDAQDTIDRIASGCHEKFDPPWEPTFIPVPLGDGSGRSVLVIRIDANTAPRPLLVDLQAPIRLSGRNSVADRDRLLQLAREVAGAGVLPMGQNLMAPSLDQDADGQPTADFILRTGVNLPMGEAGTWRPLSEKSVAALARALNASPLPKALLNLVKGGVRGSLDFHPLGHNRARTARLVWQAYSSTEVKHPVEAVVTVKLPDVYGPTPTGPIATLTIDVISRAQRYAVALGETEWTYRYPVPDLAVLLDGILETAVSEDVATELARITDIDRALVAQPRELHLIADRSVPHLLRSEGLQEIPDAGASRGGIFRANPALDLRLADERQEQVDDWLRQLGLDAGLTGMEALLERYRAELMA